MTILVSNTSSKLIVMLADSIITTSQYSVDGTPETAYYTYETKSKYFKFPGVGCITTWGDQTYNNLGSFLGTHKISPDTHTVLELVDLVYVYLAEIYVKGEGDELGFHIGGFDKEGNPRLFHVFWGYNRPKQPNEHSPAVHRCDHSGWVFLYNGRNDLAAAVINTLVDLIGHNEEIRFQLGTPIGRIAFCDFIARFASELTPQVGPPFVIHLIFSDNSIEKIENTSFGPLSIQCVSPILQKLFDLKSDPLFQVIPLFRIPEPDIPEQPKSSPIAPPSGVQDLF